MNWTQIYKGTVNNLLKNNQATYEDRMKICRECKLLKKDEILGEICDSKKFLNPETNELSDTKKDGFYRGCGCILGSKTRVKEATCPLNKW